jgi:hypothetical protein
VPQWHTARKQETNKSGAKELLLKIGPVTFARDIDRHCPFLSTERVRVFFMCILHENKLCSAQGVSRDRASLGLNPKGTLHSFWYNGKNTRARVRRVD